VIVENPHTGEILALANRPTFNPNRYGEAPREALKNRAVSDVYEPGSTFKLVTVSGALEEKLTNPSEAIDCQMGAIYIAGVRIRDHEPFGLLTVSQIIAHSSDVGAIKLGLRLGDERFYHYIRAFGFGSQTGIELPGETRGLSKPVNRWSKVSIGAISMGQEIGISAVQLVAAVSAVANDGLWTAPRIVAGFAEPRSTPQTVVFHPGATHRVVSPLTAAEMKKMLEDVVLFGTGKKAILDGYTSAGKTGTAQKVDPATGAYSKTKYVASFVGFAPVNDPAISVAVILDSAVGLHQGGQIAAPVFARVVQQTLAYLNVPHDVAPNPQRLLLRASVKDTELEEESPDRLSGGLEVAQDAEPEPPPQPSPPQPAAPSVAAPRIVAASAAAAKPLPAAQSLPSKPAPPPPEEAPSNGTVVVDVGNTVVVPSLLGKSLRSAIVAAQQAGVEIEAIGSGIAREQSPAPGSRIPASSRVSVRFAR
jgi:cell division protein FtsI (penicillin-binding protein 3)